MRLSAYLSATIAALFISPAHANIPPLMSPEWAAQACQAFNANPILTDELGQKWVKNHGGRGYKVIHLYRDDCGERTKVQLTIVPDGNKARCSYGGRVVNPTLDEARDYKMWATTQRWREMGAGEYGPMRAMMFNRLRFEGPKAEAMSVMGPFEQFLLLPGRVPGSDACPAAN